MAKFKLEIDLESDSLVARDTRTGRYINSDTLADMLQRISYRIRSNGVHPGLRVDINDENGNTVGQARVTKN